MLLHVQRISHLRDYVLRVEFTDGVVKDVDLEGELHGEIFEPLTLLCQIPGRVLASVSGVDSCLSLSMALLDLADDVFRVVVVAWQDASQEDLDVRCAQQRQGLFLKLPFTEKKQQGHHDKGHVVIPGLPAAGLVLIHAGFVLGLLKGPFHPIALPLHVGESRQRSVYGRVAEAVFDRLGICLVPRGDQLPAASFGVPAFQQPNGASQGLDSQLSLAGVANPDLLPGFRGLLSHPGLHGNGGP